MIGVKMKEKPCEFLERHRKLHPVIGISEKGDMFGFFEIRKPYGGLLYVISSGNRDDKYELSKFEHVSVSSPEYRMPSWDDMCFVKSLFWDDEETVIQYHPKKSEYVNININCLHLWKPPYDLPLPPKECI